ncbi:hypothetical protein QBC40DRAFT_45404 [Triangularia verruculosa]|uniref:Uncharacterized protein n=1 Tax=Triangularia verruculosa TaxID=2587418 RepID=A0AAN6XA01_9PEZI|nr:hypothetical protein QBC40DRAFT_45404 [Triangularia verruculosa]
MGIIETLIAHLSRTLTHIFFFFFFFLPVALQAGGIFYFYFFPPKHITFRQFKNEYTLPSQSIKVDSLFFCFFFGLVYFFR